MSASDQRAREAAELRLAMDEIEAAAPRRGEDTELAEQAERLGNLEDLRLAAATAREALSSESLEETSDVLGLLDGAKRQLERAAGTRPGARLDRRSAHRNGHSRLRGRRAPLQLPERTGCRRARDLEAVQERRAELNALVRKYGPTLEDTIDQLESGSDRLLELDNDSDRIELLRGVVEADEARGGRPRSSAHRIRTVAAARLAELVSAELDALAMPGARLEAELSDAGEYSADRQGPRLAALGTPPRRRARPLGRGASGGELSRVMLAIEVVIAGSDPVPTFVFDEVDAGVGGASAIEVGRRLARWPPPPR